MSGIEEYQRLNTRPASLLTIGGFRPTRNPFASHFGLAPLASPGEGWPQAGRTPLFFVCQLNLTEAPHVPEALRGVALITVFIDREARRPERENGDGWLLRAYADLESLEPLAVPVGATMPRGFEVRYHLAEDHPVFDDPELTIPPGFDRTDVHLDNLHRTKIGGYASNIQSEPWWDTANLERRWGVGMLDGQSQEHPSRPRYVFQIASEDKVGLYWGDNGIMYFARGTAPGCESQWFLDTQCC